MRVSCPGLVVQREIIQGKMSGGKNSRGKLFRDKCPGSRVWGVIVLEGIS